MPRPSAATAAIAASSCAPQSQRREPSTSPVRHSECTRTSTSSPVTQVPVHQRDVLGAVDRVQVAQRPPFAVRVGQPGLHHPADLPLGVPPVLDELGDGDHRQAVPVGECPQLGQPGHGAVVVEDLGHHAGRGEPGQPGQVHRGLGVPGAAEHPALGVPQREDVAGPDDLVGLGRGVDEHPHGPGPVRRGDAGGDAVAGVHADRERGAHVLLVVTGHRRHLQPVQVLAQHAARRSARGRT